MYYENHKELLELMVTHTPNERVLPQLGLTLIREMLSLIGPSITPALQAASPLLMTAARTLRLGDVIIVEDTEESGVCGCQIHRLEADTYVATIPVSLLAILNVFDRLLSFQPTVGATPSNSVPSPAADNFSVSIGALERIANGASPDELSGFVDSLFDMETPSSKRLARLEPLLDAFPPQSGETGLSFTPVAWAFLLTHEISHLICDHFTLLDQAAVPADDEENWRIVRWFLELEADAIAFRLVEQVAAVFQGRCPPIGAALEEEFNLLKSSGKLNEQTILEMAGALQKDHLPQPPANITVTSADRESVLRSATALFSVIYIEETVRARRSPSPHDEIIFDPVYPSPRFRTAYLMNLVFGDDSDQLGNFAVNFVNMFCHAAKATNMLDLAVFGAIVIGDDAKLRQEFDFYAENQTRYWELACSGRRT